jgi:glycosyltransferase involved in cell wall biosynthesis
VNCLLADEPAAFAEACVRLLADPDLRRALGQNARQLAETVYSQDAIVPLVRETVEQCLRAHKPD